MTPRNRNFMIGIIVLLVILFGVWLYIPKAQLTIQSQPDKIQLGINGKQYQVQSGQSIRLRNGTYPYIANQEGYTVGKGFVEVKDSKKNQLTIELRKLTLFEKEYPEGQNKYPNTSVATEYQPQADWLVVQLVSNDNADKKTLLILNKASGKWQIVTTGQDFVTPIQIVDKPQALQNWLTENNFVSNSNVDEEVN